MVSASGLVRGTEKTCRYLDSSPDDRPLGVQLFGSDPDTLAEAARIAAERGADLLDVNMGCPVKKVVKTGSGASLMRDPERVAAILRAVQKGVDLPLTVKIRAGWNARQINALEIGQIAEECGVDAVILHPRTADQGFGGTVGLGADRGPQGAAADPRDRERRCPLPGGCGPDVPGDRLRRGYGRERGAWGIPGSSEIFCRICPETRISVPSLAEREEIIRRHLTLAIDFYGEKVGTRDFRKHLLWYTKGLRGGAQFRQAAGRISDRDCGLERRCGTISSVWRRPSAAFPNPVRRARNRSELHGERTDNVNGLSIIRVRSRRNKVLTFMGQVGIIDAKFARCRGPDSARVIHD